MDDQLERPLVTVIVVNGDAIDDVIEGVEKFLPGLFDVVVFSREPRSDPRIKNVPDPGSIGARIVAGICHSTGHFVMVVDGARGLPNLAGVNVRDAQKRQVWVALARNFVVVSKELAAVVAVNLHMEGYGAVFEVVVLARFTSCCVEKIPCKSMRIDVEEIFARAMILCAYHLQLWPLVPYY